MGLSESGHKSLNGVISKYEYMLAREVTMSDQARLKRDKIRDKNKRRREKKHQEHHLTDEFREELRATMQETSRLLALHTCPN